MIKIEKAEVEISESTVKSLLEAIKKAKETIDFINEPMPEGDMSIYQGKKAERERGIVTVSAPYENASYKIRLETRPHSQESARYKLDELPEPEVSSCPKGWRTLIEVDKNKDNNL